MQLSLFSDYSLRVLLYLAVRPEKIATIREIAETYRISKNHLMKVVNELARRGYVKTTRGHAGGLSLALPPEEINIGEVLALLEKRIPLLECFDDARNTCLLSPECRLKGALAKAQKAFFNTLEEYTLADMAMRNHPLFGK